MPNAPLPLRQRPAFAALAAHYAAIEDKSLRQLFDEDPRRGERLTAEAVGLYLDYSKNRVTDETMQLLVELAEFCLAVSVMTLPLVTVPSERTKQTASKPPLLPWPDATTCWRALKSGPSVASGRSTQV